MTVWSCWGGIATARSIRGERKVWGEGCDKTAPLAETALHRDIPAMGAGNGPGQAKPAAGSELGAARFSIAPIPRSLKTAANCPA